MRGHTQSAKLLSQACNIGTTYLTFCGNTENKTKAGKAGAIEAIVVAMSGHPENQMLQRNACAALDNTIHTIKENGTRAGRAGAVESVVAAMRAHSGNAEVLCCAGLALIRMITRNAVNRKKAEDPGVIDVVLVVMRGHTQSAELQTQACSILSALTSGNTENKTKAGNAGAIEAVVVAMRRHAQNDDVQTWALDVLSTMSDSHTRNRIKAANAGAVEAIAAVIRSSLLGGENLLDGACRTMRCLQAAPRDVGSNRGGWARALEAVVDAIRDDAGSATMQADACGALRNLIESIAENVALAETADAVEAVVVVMRKHADSAQLQERACEHSGISPPAMSRTTAMHGSRAPLKPWLRRCTDMRHVKGCRSGRAAFYGT
jgi:hypothetical protein